MTRKYISFLSVVLMAYCSLAQNRFANNECFNINCVINQLLIDHNITSLNQDSEAYRFTTKTLNGFIFKKNEMQINVNYNDSVLLCNFKGINNYWDGVVMFKYDNLFYCLRKINHVDSIIIFEKLLSNEKILIYNFIECENSDLNYSHILYVYDRHRKQLFNIKFLKQQSFLQSMEFKKITIDSVQTDNDEIKIKSTLSSNEDPNVSSLINTPICLKFIIKDNDIYFSDNKYKDVLNIELSKPRMYYINKSTFKR